ncbi:putative transposase-like protein [Trichonephila clavipes]|nr:putative transposase-like protein [Trichonephila clavipes]
MTTLPDCRVRWLKYGNPKTGQAKKSSISALDPAATRQVYPCSFFLPQCSDFWLDFAPVVRMACERKFLESEATTGFFLLLGKQGNKAVLDWTSHSLTFKDPETGAHTNAIEGTWSAIKRSLKDHTAHVEGQFDSYLAEYMGRRSNEHKMIDANFRDYLKAIARVYPPQESDDQKE